MDYGHSETDKQLKKLEGRIEKEYRRAAIDVKKKTRDYLDKYKAKDAVKRQQLKDGTITKQEYQQWKTGQIMIGKRWEEMRDTLYQDLSNANGIARSMITGFTHEVYALNHNYGTFEVESDSLLDTSYTLYDRDTVYNLIKDRPTLLPRFDETQKELDKSERWSKAKMDSAVLQGILQGESMDGIAKRLTDVVGMDERIAIRNARTMTTAAENLGRQNSYKRAEKMGINLENEWVATLDGRTRHSHRMMDGETRKIGDEFSNGCEYPGDPSGDPSEVYNCRCTLIAAVDGIDYDLADVENLNGKLGEMSYDEWKWQHTTEVDKYKHLLGEAQYHKGTIPDKTYSGIWKNDVTLADYASKKDSIQAKRQYYEDKNKEAQMLGIQTDRWNNYLKDLDEFEQLGKKYEKYQNEINDYSKKIKELGGSSSMFSPDAYTEERRRLAKSFDNAREADRYHRSLLDKGWDNLTDREKYSVWEYTHNSNPMNQPLSGYNDGWSRSRFVGVGNADWGYQDNWRYVNSKEFIDKFSKNGTGNVDYTRTIADLTKAIDKSSFVDDVFLVRGSDKNGLAGLFEGDLFSYDDAYSILTSGDKNKIKNAFEGQTFQGHSFLSTGIAKGTGFSGDVSYTIYAPSGTKAIYAEPQSYYGSTIKGEEIYKAGKRYSSVGYEAEVILQRGTQYRVRSIDYDWGNIRIELDVVGQPDYFATGFEETFNGGATLHTN